jgi:hypothetical protein
MEGLPVPGTIRWHVAHLEHCARHYIEILRNRPLAHEPATSSPGIADLAELINRLERARRLLREEIQRLSEMDLDAPCARGMNVGEFVRMAIRSRNLACGPDCGCSKVVWTAQRKVKLEKTLLM